MANIAKLPAPTSVCRRLILERSLTGQFVIMEREIVEQDARVAATDFRRAVSPMFLIAYHGATRCR